MVRKRVGIVIFPDVEVLDFTGPYEVLTVLRLDEAKRREEPSPFEVLLVAENTDAIRTSAGMKVLPDCTFDDCPELDILIVPGGWGVRREMANARLISWLGQAGRKVETLASACTGSMLLGQAGLLEGCRATTHWRSLDWMRDSFPVIDVVTDAHVVEDGHVITSAGISAGIDMALRVVARYFGEDKAESTARHMEYAYGIGNQRRVRLNR